MLWEVLFWYLKKNTDRETRNIFQNQDRNFQKLQREYATMDKKRGDDMIEIICREKQQEEQEINLPKNIRQVGSPKGRHKIYIEDYVYTYLRNQAQASSKCAAVLLGKSCVSRDMRYTFISGAIECGQAVFQFDSIYLDESFWEYIYAEEKEYFPDTMIVGWFVGEQGETMNLSAAIESAHRKYFAGRDKVLMLMDTEEEEELFYIYEQGYLQKREGYYVYYEKNIAMQEYMIRKKEQQQILKEPEGEPEEEASPIYPKVSETDSEWESLHKEIREETISEEVISEEVISEETVSEETISEESKPVSEKIFVKSSMEEPVSEAEKALQHYRYTMLEKRGHKVERQNKRFLYVAASFFMLVFCVIGITTINNYRKMQEVEDVLHVMKGESEEESASDLIVQSVASDVTPIEEGQEQEQPAEEQQGTTSQQPSEQQQEAAQPQTATEAQQTVAPDAQQEAAQPQAATEAQQTTAPDTQQEAASQQTEPQYYTVQAGDTLESICLKIYQDRSKVAALCQANGIQNGNQIQAGQKLILP